MNHQVIPDFQARQLDSAMIFFDECDSIFGARDDGEQAHVLSMKSQFLQEIEGMSATKYCE